MTEPLLPPAFTLPWTCLLGLVVGSFLNVVIHRLPRGLSIVRPRSRCPGCARSIRWFENVPVLSWLILRGRCAGCRARISWRYPAVELLTGAVFGASHLALGFTPALAVALPFAAAILALVFIDLEHMLLPDAITLPMTYVGLALSLVSPLTTPEDALLGVVLCWCALEGVNLAYRLVRGRDGFGGGDTKMMMMVGAFLGWELALFTLAAGIFLGALLGVPAFALARWVRRRSTAVLAPAPPFEDANADDAEAPESEQAAEPARWGDLLPRSLEEALPLLIVPAVSLTWVIEDASPARSLVGLLVTIAACVLAARWLRRRGSRSPALPALVLAGALAGLPARPAPILLAVAVLAGALALFRPPIVAPLPAGETGDGPPEDAFETADSVMEAAIPFGVFLGMGAILALVAGEEVVAWYLGWSGRMLDPMLTP